MTTDQSETQSLLRRVTKGEKTAFEELFRRHRGRLRRAIAMRMDRRLAGRVDASDVLQETYLEAFRRLPRYVEQQGMPFYLWLRWIAREKVLATYRRHLGAGKRTIAQEAGMIPADSSAEFVSGIMDRGPTPSQELAKAELAESLQAALSRLDENDRDLILWRHFDQLTIREVAQMLAITEGAAGKRYVRALERLRKLLADLGVSKRR